MTFQPSVLTHPTHGVLSATTSIATITSSHHVASQLPTPPRETPGPTLTTATAPFDPHAHHHLISIHPHSLHQPTSSRWSTTHRGLPLRNQSSAPHPQFATMHHVQAPGPPANMPQHLSCHRPLTSHHSVPLWCCITDSSGMRISWMWSMVPTLTLEPLEAFLTEDVTRTVTFEGGTCNRED